MFEMRSYSRKELALLYFPHCSPKSAYMNFRRWLNEHEEACDLLDKIKFKKIFNRTEVERIVAILGKP